MGFYRKFHRENRRQSDSRRMIQWLRLDDLSGPRSHDFLAFLKELNPENLENA